jgi:hypothetical protein
MMKPKSATLPEQDFTLVLRAMEIKVQSAMPLVGIAIDRRVLRHLGESFRADNIKTLMCSICECKYLAYTAYSNYSRPQTVNESFYLQSYVGTQADKLEDAMAAMVEILNDMPEVENQFEASKKSIMKRIASDRRIKDSKFFTYLSYKQLGINTDYRKTIYEAVQNADMASMKTFFDSKVKGKPYSIMVLGDRTKIDKSILGKYGQVTELSLEEIFGY